MYDIGALSLRVVTAVMIVGISASPAYAYLDPGTGSIILQVLLGGIAGIVIAGKLYWNKLRLMFGAGERGKGKGQPGNDRGPDVNEAGRD